MADVKWVRITTDMFSNRKIKYLRTLPEGNNIILIWIMLITLAGRCNSGGMVFLTESIAYTTKMLADELNFEENTIILALNALEKLGMIQNYNENLLITGWEEHQNTDGLEKLKEQNRARQEKYRKKQQLLLGNNVISNVTDNVSDSYSNAIDKEEDKEKDINNNVHPSDGTSNTSKKDIDKFFETVWHLYPVKKGKGSVSKTQKNKLYGIGLDEIKRCIERYSYEQSETDLQFWKHGSTFFNSGYVDYLDCNYKPEDHKPKKLSISTNTNNTFNNYPQRDTSKQSAELERKMMNMDYFGEKS